MSDRRVDAIKEVKGTRLSFQWLRSTLKADHDLRDSLDFGHAIIDEVKKLDQYLYSYGPMIESQWENVAAHLREIGRPDAVIDYGCGQGLAGILISDLTDGALFGDVRNIALIEPSAVALRRATALYERIAPEAVVRGICKQFDDLSEDDIPFAGADHTLHLFSNSLDIPGFEPLELLGKTLGTGRHTILAVSHDRDFNGGTPQIEAVKASIEHPSNAPPLDVKRSQIDLFTCDNPGKSKGLVWLCELEVRDG